MRTEFSRLDMLLDSSSIEKISAAKIIVFGVGGVGSYAVEALSRCGVCRLDLVDSDTVSETNINRQIIALHSTIGRYKVEVAKERILDISPTTSVDTYNLFYDESTKELIDLSKYDYIIDAIDSMNSKVLLVKEAKRLSVPIISALSTGNKLDITKFRVSDIFDTSVCPIAKIMRKKLRDEGVDSLKVIFSSEMPITPNQDFAIDEIKRTVGSVSFVPSAVGLMLASEVVRDIVNWEKK